MRNEMRNEMRNNKLIKDIVDEKVEYVGPRNFASKGIKVSLEGLLKAFNYGVEVGVECTKKDVIRLIKKHMHESV